MIWLLGLLLVGALIALFVVWDVVCCRGRRCAALADRFVVDPQLRTARRERDEAERRASRREVAR